MSSRYVCRKIPRKFSFAFNATLCFTTKRENCRPRPLPIRRYCSFAMTQQQHQLTKKRLFCVNRAEAIIIIIIIFVENFRYKSSGGQKARTKTAASYRDIFICGDNRSPFLCEFQFFFWKSARVFFSRGFVRGFKARARY